MVGSEKVWGGAVGIVEVGVSGSRWWLRRVRVGEVERETVVWGLLGCIEMRLKTLILGLGVLRM